MYYCHFSLTTTSPVRGLNVINFVTMCFVIIMAGTHSVSSSKAVALRWKGLNKATSPNVRRNQAEIKGQIC